MVIQPQLDPRLDTPLYRQLYDYIRSAIDLGTLGVGERLPATRELAGLLGLNRTTVSAAYELLETEGLIRGHVGRGSFVAARAVPQEGISFGASRPAAELFPLDDFRQTCEEVIRGPDAAAILQLGPPNGYAPLRDYLLEQARASGDAGPKDDVLVTSGCQQGMDLVSRVLAAAGEAVAVEDPVYPGLRSAFHQRSHLIGLPADTRGLDVETTESTIRGQAPRLTVLAPDFQNPTGTTLSGEQRHRILSAAADSRTLIVENDVYGDLRYMGERKPTIRSLDLDCGTILLRSFSKVAFPGLRVGWIIGSRDVIRKLAEAKRWCDLHTDQLSQAVLLRFAQTGRLGQHRARVLKEGAERLRATLQACGEHLPAGSRYSRPEGGMHVWVELPGGIDTAEVLGRAQRAGVSYLPGNYFSVARDHSHALRLSFAGLAPAQIEKGIASLGAVLKQELERAPEPALV